MHSKDLVAAASLITLLALASIGCSSGTSSDSGSAEDLRTGGPDLAIEINNLAEWEGRLTVTADDRFVYWCEGLNVMRAPRDGSAHPTEIATASSPLSSIAVDREGSLYYFDDGDLAHSGDDTQAVYKVEGTQGSAPHSTKIFVAPQVWDSSSRSRASGMVAFSNGSLYVTGRESRSGSPFVIWKVERDGRAQPVPGSAIAEGSGVGKVGQLGATRSSVFWTFWDNKDHASSGPIYCTRLDADPFYREPRALYKYGHQFTLFGETAYFFRSAGGFLAADGVTDQLYAGTCGANEEPHAEGLDFYARNPWGAFATDGKMMYWPGMSTGARDSAKQVMAESLYPVHEPSAREKELTRVALVLAVFDVSGPTIGWVEMRFGPGGKNFIRFTKKP